MALIICNVLNAFWKKISGTFIKIDQFLVDVPDNHNDILETIYSSLTLFSLKKRETSGKNVSCTLDQSKQFRGRCRCQ